MPYQNRNAVSAINGYLWKALRLNLNMSDTDYRGLVPIIPATQEPEIMEFGKPFIVYGQSRMESGHLYNLKQDVIAYRVYAGSYTECNNLANFVSDLFQEQDVSASNVNYWMDSEQAAVGKNRSISFGTIKTLSLDGPGGDSSEGGWFAATVLVKVNYIEKSNNSTLNTRFTY